MLPAKFGTCLRCVALAALALVLSLGMTSAALASKDAAALGVALGLVAVSAAFVALHAIGWRRQHESSRAH